MYACLLACMLACLLSCLLACLLACLPACLLACMLACWLTCWLSCILACFHACLLACRLPFLLACLPACLQVSLPACLLTCLLACLLACLSGNPRGLFRMLQKLICSVLLRKVPDPRTHGRTRSPLLGLLSEPKMAETFLFWYQFRSYEHKLLVLNGRAPVRVLWVSLFILYLKVINSVSSSGGFLYFAMKRVDLKYVDLNFKLILTPNRLKALL